MNTNLQISEYGKHPLETGEYKIGTSAIDFAYEVICNLLKNRSPGGIFVGPQRYGKTCAIEYLIKLLLEEENISAVLHTVKCKHHNRTISDNRYYEELLVSFNHEYAKSGNATDKFKRIIEYLNESVLLAGYKHMIIFFDDAHRLDRHQYEWLIDIYNELIDLKITPLLLFFGQPELAYQRNTLLRGKQKQIIGRFMSHEYIFHGIRNTMDIIVCLETFDGKYPNTDYPKNSGYSFTRYYFPKAYDAGWRFVNLAESIWMGFLSLRKKYLLSTDFEIPMQHLCLTLEYLYINYSDKFSIIPTISDQNIEEAIYQSGYIEFELSLITK